MDGNKPTPSQRKSGIIAIVDAPEISLSNDDDAGHVLLKFYRALGWNGEDILDPCKVRTTKAVYTWLYDLMLERCSDTLTVGFALVNIGPGVNKDIQPNKVHLLDGWISPQDAQ